MKLINILLLEDNSSDAELTIRALKKACPQCTVNHVTSIQEARKALATKTDFDIALLDMQLPDGNGMDILMEIRQKQLDMAVVVLTGSGNEEVAVAALKAGADDYTVKKPGYTDKVPRSVELAMENHRQYRERTTSMIHVLYIEHNAADIDFTRRHLTRYAPYIRLTDVPDGKKALVLLPQSGTSPEEWDHQLIIMDYRLPGMNALEIIKEIRMERKLDIPILIVTGQGNEGVAVQALKVGANEYLVKQENYLSRLPSLISGAYEHIELKRKQKALEKSETQYRLLAENSDDLIFTLDFNLCFTYVSPAVYSLHGFRTEELINQEFAKILTPASFKKVQQLFDRYLPAISNGKSTAKPMTVELEALKTDGSTVWVEIKLSLLTDTKGESSGILGVSRDISKRIAAQTELRKLSRAVEQSPDSIVITNKDGDIEYVNPKFTELTGYTKEEVIGKNPSILSSGEHPDSYYKELWDTVLAGKDWHGEFRDKKKSGDLYWESANISPLLNSDGVITHFVAVKEDITEQKNMIDELIKAKEKAEESDRLKSAFLANMSHEIRTPMNGILGFTSLLLEPDLTTEEKTRYIGIVHKSGQRMLNTVNDIIEISKIEAGLISMHITPVGVNELLTEMVAFFTPEAEKKGLKLNLTNKLSNDHPAISSDKNKLDSILMNLIKNAIKHTNSGTINIGCKQDNKNLEFYVQDTGIGIPANRRGAIFNRFEQADIADSSALEGLGLGLSIAKSYVEMLDGKIWVESEVGIGSTFYFTLPNNEEKQEKNDIDNHTTTPQTTTERRLKVLIAEDDEASYMFMKTILSMHNITSIYAANGLEAVNAFNKNPDISLILMDIKMPVMNGMEATRQIRQTNKTIPIIAQTAYAFQSEKVDIMNSGCNDLLAKPILQEELLKMILRYFPAYETH